MCMRVCVWAQVAVIHVNLCRSCSTLMTNWLQECESDEEPAMPFFLRRELFRNLQVVECLFFKLAPAESRPLGNPEAFIQPLSRRGAAASSLPDALLLPFFRLWFLPLLTEADKPNSWARSPASSVL